MMNQNAFANAARIAASVTYTENGHAAASTTGSALLDLYGQAGALRGQDERRIIELLDRAIAEDRLLATKIMFYARDCRGGTGEREVFRTMLKHMAKVKPGAVIENLELIPKFGRWDDLYSLVGTPAEKYMWDFMQIQLFRDIRDMSEGKSISLMAKWLKSCNASSADTRMLGRLTREHLGYSEKEYRKVLKRLRDHIRIVESQMSRNEWDKIDYEKVPSRAGMIYQEAFKKHDEERYNEYIDSVLNGEKKINTSMNTPQDLVHAYVKGVTPARTEDPTIEAMWNNLPDYIQSDENVLCMVDTSGSMYGRPIEIAAGLGMYFAQRNTGAFHNLFMTFQSVPSFVSLDDGVSMLANLSKTWYAPWGGSTDLNRACEAMLDMAEWKDVPQKDMPTRLVIISDMEIDEAAGRSKDILHADELREMYERAGYRMPQVIYWNVESRHSHFQTRCDIPGTMLASGSSPRVFEAVMQMKDCQVTPYDAMLEVLNGDRYKEVK